MNAGEREPVETRVFNPNVSEASYKPKQRSYRKTWGGDFPGGSIPRTLLSLVPVKLFLIYGYFHNASETQKYIVSCSICFLITS